MLAGDRSATCGHEADDDQGYGDQGKDEPRDHTASVPSAHSTRVRLLSPYGRRRRAEVGVRGRLLGAGRVARELVPIAGPGPICDSLLDLSLDHDGELGRG